MDLLDPKLLLKRIRWMTGFAIFGLVLSGLSALPLRWQLELAQQVVGTGGNAAADWVATLLKGLAAIQEQAPFILYGIDWLAFAHIALGLLFIGAWKDPVRNVWLFQFGLITCALVVPWAWVFGEIRGIPWWHRAVDASFGVVCAVPFGLALKWTQELEGCRG
jgi:hypothetical protein